VGVEMFSQTGIRLFKKNLRTYSKKNPNEPHFTPEMEQSFIKTLSPELQDLYRRGASGQADDYEIAKYMRSKMTQEEMNKIMESSFFDDYMKDPQFKMPQSVDPDRNPMKYVIFYSCLLIQSSFQTINFSLFFHVKKFLFENLIVINILQLFVSFLPFLIRL
jgi:hypothetical protein